MLYTAIRPLQIYKAQEYVPLPKGDKIGFGNIVFLLSSSRGKSKEILVNKFLDYHSSLYKYYYIDFIYNSQIGRKRIIKNNSSVFKKEFNEIDYPYTLKIVPTSTKMNILSKDYNLIVDLGEWNDIYFKNSLKVTQASVCENYISFIASKINESIYDNYQKIIYIDLHDWFIENSAIFGLSKKYLTNPLSIFMLSLYRYEDILKNLGPVTLLIVDSKNGQFLKLDSTYLQKSEYTKVKSKILSLTGLSSKVSKNIDSEENGTPETSDTELVDSLKATDTEKIYLNSRKLIMNSLKRNLIGEVDVDDISSEYIDSEDEDTEEIDIDSEYNDEIENVANQYIDENPDILDADPDDAAKELEKVIIKKVYISKFMPERSLEEIEKNNELYGIQQEIIKSPSYTNLESKIIDTTDLSQTLVTNNANIITSKFKNFDNSYNRKKLNQDIDEAVSILSNAEHKIFITDKSEEDTSDQLNLKRTLTYKLQDEHGRNMSIKLDIPTIIDDKYVYLNGNKKILQHQLVLKPLVKTDADTVQLVTFFLKIFITRKNENDLISTSIQKYLLKNIDKFSVKTGNATIKNKETETPIEFDIISNRIYEFKINDNRFIMDINELIKVLDSLNINYKRIDLDKNILLGYNTKSKELIYMNRQSDVFVNILFKYFSEDDIKQIKSTKITRLMYSQCTMMQKAIPLIFFLLFCEGFTSVMKKAGIEYKFVTRKEAKDYDYSEYGKIELADGIIVWKRYPFKNSLLMCGMSLLPTSMYSFEELDSKDTYVTMMTEFYAYSSNSFNLDQYKDFMIDNITKEILEDYHLPTDLVSLLIYANSLLTDNTYRAENDLHNVRIRSNELIPYFVYRTITSAYGPYRKTAYKDKPTPISVKRDAVLKAIKTSKLTEESSVLNAILELEKNRSVTYKGSTMGINVDRALTLTKRAYNSSMIGILGISTPDDASTGMTRQITLEPNITSTRGYIEVTPMKDVDKLTSANLLTPAELLTPMAVQHDDPARTAMMYKQSKFSIPIKDGSPVLIGNRVESIIPYHISREFSIVAKNDGKVIDINNGYIIIQYNDGSYDSIDITPQIKKNAASGFFIEAQLVCNKKIGDSIKKDEVVAYNANTFSRTSRDNSVSMNLGVLTKIAVLPNWDIYEDSAPITEKLADQLSTTMINEKEVALNKDAFVQRIVKIGDKVKTGDALIVFDSFPDDPDAAKFLETLREDLKTEIIESSITSIKSKYSGEIADIKLYSTVDPEELSPSLRELVNAQYDRLRKREQVLDKYKNKNDSKYYKCNQLITESPVKIEPDSQGKIKGVTVGEGVLIAFYIKYTDIAATGDKSVAFSALKSINSHVIDPGYEPYSEFAPDEEISTIISPLSISARKTPSIFYNMFGNKMLIYLKRQLKEKYLEEK